MANDNDALNDLRAVSDTDAVHRISHYLYFPEQQAAKEVAQVLRQRGFEIEDRLGADGVNWLVLASVQAVPTEAAIAEMRESLEELADDHEGEYDGWEAEVP